MSTETSAARPPGRDLFLGLRFGTYDEALRWVGRSCEPRPCEDEITWAAIKYFCALVEDANPAYWDPDEAERRYGGLVAPPGMLMVWQTALPWRPRGRIQDFMIATQVPLPGKTIIIVSTDSEFFHPIRAGQRLTVQEKVEAVSPEKRTALGVGHFVTTFATFSDPQGQVVATNRNLLLRYQAFPDAGISSRQGGASSTRGAASPLNSRSVGCFEDVAQGQVLPAVMMPVTLMRCVLDAAATRDFFPGHHDRDYARGQNARDVYLNTMFFHGFVDRVVTDWTGPDFRLVRRRLDMIAPVCVGDTISTAARVTSRRVEKGRGMVEVEVNVMMERGLGARARVVGFLPRASTRAR